jgi:hypothetical protein
VDECKPLPIGATVSPTVPSAVIVKITCHGLQATVRPGRCCSPRQPTLFEPSCLQFSDPIPYSLYPKSSDTARHVSQRYSSPRVSSEVTTYGVVGNIWQALPWQALIITSLTRILNPRIMICMVSYKVASCEC